MLMRAIAEAGPAIVSSEPYEYAPNTNGSTGVTIAVLAIVYAALFGISYGIVSLFHKAKSTETHPSNTKRGKLITSAFIAAVLTIILFAIVPR